MSDIDRQNLPALPEIPSVTNEDPATVSRLAQDLDLTRTDTILNFGTQAQADLRAISQEMLVGVKGKSTGPAGDALSRMVSTIRGFNDAPVDMRSEKTFLEKIMGRLAPAARFLALQEEVQTQVNAIADDLMAHETVLMKDIRALDTLYARAADYYKELQLYIVAGETRLSEVDTVQIPAAEQAMAQAPEDRKMLLAQELRDLRSARDELERRIHDLKLTRQVTMQSLPSIRLVQENDKSLVLKIRSTLANTVPLWETQMAHHYGYIKGTKGRDKDHIDVFMGSDAAATSTASMTRPAWTWTRSAWARSCGITDWSPRSRRPASRR